MPKPASERRSLCPIDYALGVIGDRWTLLVVRDLLFRGRRHFRELLDAEEGIATNILTDRLRKLETAQLVSRRPDPDSGRQVIYELTEKGLALTPVLVELIRWSAKYDEKTPVSTEFQKRLDEDRDGVIAETIEQNRTGHGIPQP